MEKLNSQLENGQPVEQTRGLFARAARVALCQSQHQYHFWQMSSMFEVYCTGNWAVNQICVIVRLWMVAKI